MANEWEVIELYGPNGNGSIRRALIADGASVSIGTLLQMLDPRTASYSHMAKVAVIGVAAEEHIANKGITEISVYTDGLFDVTVSGAPVLGSPLMTSLQDNKLQPMVDTDTTSAALINTLGNRIVAYAYETGTDQEKIAVRLKL